MANEQRKLNIPRYESPGEEDIIDAEVIEPRPTLADRLADRLGGRGRTVPQATAQETRAQQSDRMADRLGGRVRGTAQAAAEGVRARQAGRAERAERTAAAAQQRAAAATASSQARSERDRLRKSARTDPVARLRLSTIEAGEEYMKSLRASEILGASQTKQTQRKQLEGMHQVYASMMVLQCVSPLQKGLSAESLVSSLGMSASMWFLSPDFRTQLGSFAGQIGDAIKDKIDNHVPRLDKKAQRKFDKLDSRGKGDQLGKRWQKRLDKIEQSEPGYRLPFTPQSAAMTEISLAETAYHQMRQPGADTAMIQDRYASSLSALYEFVEADGIPREEVSRSMRVMVGLRLPSEPALAGVFSELGHGRFTKSEPREVYPEGSTVPTKVWTGDFVDSYDSRTISSGSFRLRQVMDVNEHRAMVGQTLASELVTASSVGELNDVLSQYAVSAAVGQYPAAVDSITDPVVRARMSKARTMFDSMSADGLAPVEQRFAYAAGFIDAVEAVERVNPELGAQWAAQHGEDWREKVTKSVFDYNTMGMQAEQERRGQGAPAQPEHSSTMDPNRFTASADGEVYDSQGPSVHDEDIVDAEIIIDDEPEAQDAAVDEAEAEQAPVDREKVWLDDGSGDPAARAVEGLSDVIADDIEGAMRANDPDGSTWEARHVYRSRQRALGKFDPQRLLSTGRITDLTDYAQEVSFDRLDAHTPWDSDLVANQRGVITVMAAKQMAASDIAPAEQDHLHAAAYVRGLEKVIDRNPMYASVVERMVARDGGNPGNWQEHEFAGALGRTSTGRAEQSYASVLESLELDAGVLDGTAHDGLIEGLRSTSDKADYAQSLNLRSTSAKVRRARVNQHYNEVETGGFAGLGSDDAAPLQDVDYQLG